MGKGVYGAYGKSVYVRGEDPKGFSPDPKCLAEWEMECVNGDTYGALTNIVNGDQVRGAYHVRGAYQYMGVLLRKINFADSIRGAYRALRSVVVYGHTGGMRC